MCSAQEKCDMPENDERLMQARQSGRDGDLTAVLASVGEVLSDDPHNLEALFLRGAAYYKLGDVNSARTDWQHVISLDPKNEAAMKWLAKTVPHGIDRFDTDASLPTNRSFRTPKRPAFQIPNWLIRSLLLFFSPRRFFTEYDAEMTRLERTGFIWFIGFSNVAVGMATVPLEMYDDVIARINWPVYFAWTFINAFVNGHLYYYVCSWWYCVRISASGGGNYDRRRARVIFLFTTLASSIPLLMLELYMCSYFDSPGEMRLSFGKVGSGLAANFFLVSFIIEFWAVTLSYRALRAVFDIKPGVTLFWFLLLPVAYYAVVDFTNFGVQNLLSFAEPDVVHAKTIDRPAFSLTHPGNWRVLTEDADYNPDKHFRIKAGVADATIEFLIIPGRVALEKSVDASVENLRGKIKNIQTIGDASQWGNYHGYGKRLQGRIAVFDYQILVFAAQDRGNAFVVIEFKQLSSAEKVEPGFVLIRASFTMKHK